MIRDRDNLHLIEDVSNKSATESQAVAKRKVSSESKQRRPVEYLPPASEKIENYARLVCHELADKLDNAYDTPEMRRELVGFLKVVASICVKQLNKNAQNPLDKESPEG